MHIFPGEHTGKTIFLQIKNTVSKWGVDVENFNSTVYIMTDNARNIGSEFSHFHENQHLHHILFTAHTLRLASNNAIKNIRWEMFERNVVLWSHIITTVRKHPNNINWPKHKLIQSVEIGWNSVYLMFKPILKQRSEITLDLQNIERNNFVPRDWKLIRSAKPIFEATKELCQENITTLSMVNPIIETI